MLVSKMFSEREKTSIRSLDNKAGALRPLSRLPRQEHGVFDQLFRFPELPLHHAGLQRKTHIKHRWSAEVCCRTISTLMK